MALSKVYRFGFYFQRVDLFTRSVYNDPMSKQFYSILCDLLKTGNSCYTVTFVDGTSISNGHQCICTGNKVVFGSLGASIDACLLAETTALSRRDSVKVIEAILGEGNHKLLIEFHVPSIRIVLVGGGHIGQAMAKISHILGFEIVVYDEREAFTVPELFPQGTELVCGSYAEVALKLELRKSDYAVILTHAHAGDYDALISLVDKDLAYLGMIGSKTKVAKIMKRATEAGVSVDLLKKVLTPVGLAIGAQTVEEIAVSIVAEMIAVQRGVSLDQAGSCSVIGKKK
jgi:xanthine/CO dehydrogenase XdhC/CoxF family maturation factor